ncbi:MAG: Bacterial membrane protein YfhO [Eubacteriales bacterium]
MASILTREGKQNYYLKAFLYGLAVSFLFFIPFILYDNGYFLFYGDFNVQQVPFYRMCHDAIRSGNIGWNWTTDLGANFIGSYTFYLLGSPFFWLTIPFPSAAVPYLMGPLLILKFGCASLTGYLYLQRYVEDKDYAVIGGMLYAFSGFSIYNIFFNHFHEAIVFFPLMLWALDEYMYKRRRGLFAVTVFACCFVNYYFFVGQVVFTLLYGFTRLFSGNWKITLRDFLLLVCEAVIGVLCACVLLVPTVLAVIQNPRVNDPPEGWNALLYDWNQRYVHILECFFFPPDIPARPNFTPKSEAKWASLGAWLPLFSMTGVIGFLKMRRKHWLKTLLGILYLMAFVPVLNSAFQLFNASYYARWFYMLTLMMSLATIIALQRACIDWKSSIKWTMGITLGIALPIGLMVKSTEQDGKKTYTFGLEDYPTRFWSYVAIAMLSLLLLTIIFKYYQRDKKGFIRRCMGGVAAISFVYALFFIALGKTQSDDAHKEIIPYSLNGGADIHLPDTRNCRVDVYDGMDNQAMFWQIPTIQAFHSIVPGSIMEFYPSVGVQRDVGSRPETKYYGLRGLTSCRWLFDPALSGKDFAVGETDANAPAMPGWRYYASQNGFKIYQNQYYIPMGFSYDSYITRSEYEQVEKENRHLLLLKTLVVENEDVKKVTGILKHDDNFLESDFSQEAYFEDCLNRKAESCSSFERDNGGFTAKINADKERLVFFSVPWEGGWSAKVNGRDAEILKVNVGFMAVKVPAGESTIRFDYTTPGLKQGALITLGGVALFAFYWTMTNRWEKKHPHKRKVYRIKRPLPGTIESAAQAENLERE